MFFSVFRDAKARNNPWDMEPLTIDKWTDFFCLFNCLLIFFPGGISISVVNSFISILKEDFLFVIVFHQGLRRLKGSQKASSKRHMSLKKRKWTNKHLMSEFTCGITRLL